MSIGTMVSLEEYLATAYEPECDFVDGCLEERNAANGIMHGYSLGLAHISLRVTKRRG